MKNLLLAFSLISICFMSLVAAQEDEPINTQSSFASCTPFVPVFDSSILVSRASFGLTSILDDAVRSGCQVQSETQFSVTGTISMKQPYRGGQTAAFEGPGSCDTSQFVPIPPDGGTISSINFSTGSSLCFAAFFDNEYEFSLSNRTQFSDAFNVYD